MPMHLSLVEKNKARMAGVRGRLTVEQVRFAEWLSLPSTGRHPSTQRELSKEIGISEQSLCEWKKIPEIRDIMDDALGAQGREAVPEAIGVLRQGLKSNNQKIALDSAKTILDRWGEVAKRGSIIASIKDMYERFNK